METYYRRQVGEVIMSVSMRTAATVLAVLGFVIVPAAHAQNAIKKCVSVESYAQIYYPTRLIVNVASDDAQKWCRFSISFPPRPPSSGNSIAMAVQSRTLSDDQYRQFVVEPLIGALPDRKDEASYLADILQKARDSIVDCFGNFLKNELDFRWIDERKVVSCSSPNRDMLAISGQVEELRTVVFYHQDLFR